MAIIQKYRFGTLGIPSRFATVFNALVRFPKMGSSLLYNMSATRSFYSFHVRFFYFMSCFIDRVSLKCPTLCPPKTGYHNTPLSSASVPDSHVLREYLADRRPIYINLVFSCHSKEKEAPFCHPLLLLSSV